MRIVILSSNPKLYSTSRIVEAAVNRGHDVKVIDHTKCTICNQNGKPVVLYRGKPVTDVDAVIPRIGASVTLYGTAVVRQFEMQKVFCANGSLSIVRARDKLRSLQLFTRAKIKTPKTVFAKFPKDKDVDMLINHVGGVPLIVKLLEGTQGLGVVLAETPLTAKSLIEAFSKLKANILIQEYVEEARKRGDIRAIVVNNKVVAAMNRVSTKKEFRSNIHRGALGIPVTLTKKEKRVAIKSAQVIGLYVSGVDFIRSKRGPLVLEVNASPGLQGIESATKADIAAKIIKAVERSAYKRVKGDKIGA